jgi:hypothetical protein
MLARGGVVEWRIESRRVHEFRPGTLKSEMEQQKLTVFFRGQSSDFY